MKSAISILIFSIGAALVFGIIAPQLLFAITVAMASGISNLEKGVPYLISFQLGLTFCIAPIVAGIISFALLRKPSIVASIFKDADELYEPSSRRRAGISAAITIVTTLVLSALCIQTWLILLPFSLP